MIDWGGVIGGVTGGVIGGCFTLIAVYFTYRWQSHRIAVAIYPTISAVKENINRVRAITGPDSRKSFDRAFDVVANYDKLIRDIHIDEEFLIDEAQLFIIGKAGEQFLSFEVSFANTINL